MPLFGVKDDLRILLPGLAFMLSACNPGSVLGSGGDSGSTGFAPDYSLAAPAHRASLPCGEANPDHLCIALKYAAFKNGTQPIVSQAAATRVVSGVNALYAQCRIQFTLESYAAVDPVSYGLSFSPGTMDELATVRERLGTSGTMLVVATGEWSGELGAGPANAWTVLPAVGPFGVVMEQSVTGAANLAAHELGHYLNLRHAADAYNVMNPVVYSNSLNLTDDQCAEARATAISFWGDSLR